VTTAEHKKRNYAAVILAAGYSSRMGCLKAALALNGATVVERVVSIFRSNGVEQIIVVLGHRHSEIASLIKHKRVQIVENRNFDQGMFSSLKAGLTRIDTRKQAFFVMPVDVPLVRPQTVSVLIDVAESNRGTIVHPSCCGRRGHPPLIPMSLVPEIVDCDDPCGLRGFLSKKEKQSVEVEVADRFILFDINYPQEYKKMLARLRSYDIPSGLECGVILNRIWRANDKLLRHSYSVAALASIFGKNCLKSGISLDLNLLQAAAVLHDIAKGQKNHARAGGEWLRKMGFDRVARIVETHHDLQFKAGDRIGEAEILYLADKLIQEDDIVGLEIRFASSLKRYGNSPEIRSKIGRRMDTAVQIKNELETILNQSLDQLCIQFRSHSLSPK